LTGSNAVAANAAITDVNAIITKLAEFRAKVGSSQNRLEFASANIAISTENAEAARSQLLDADIAVEITRFTSQQILVQAGVSALAQANQLPQNLLRLFQ
jgi:flagellin